jgi:hypothetical protein
MSIPTFVEGYPQDGSSLGNTRVQIRRNLDGTFEAFSVDHQNQNEAGPGSHAQAQFKNFPGTFPAVPAGLYGTGYETLYSAAIAGSGELAFVRGAGTTGIQLTGPGTPLTLSNGYTFMAGGILIQWGFVAGSSSSTIPVLFATANTNFPNACFVVTAIPIRSSSSPGSDFATAILTSSVSNLGFTIANIGGHSTDGWYWIAIGN